MRTQHGNHCIAFSSNAECISRYVCLHVKWLCYFNSFKYWFYLIRLVFVREGVTHMPIMIRFRVVALYFVRPFTYSQFVQGNWIEFRTVSRIVAVVPTISLIANPQFDNQPKHHGSVSTIRPVSSGGSNANKSGCTWFRSLAYICLFTRLIQKKHLWSILQFHWETYGFVACILWKYNNDEL